jgi:CheY-like chemotaxis protein
VGLGRHSQGELVEILLVEDNPGDVRLTQEALREAKVANRVHALGDGDAALAFLRRQGEHARAPRPDLILLDLNLPGRDGRALLADLKQDPDLGRIPVIVLSASEDAADVQESYDLHANCYVAKPVDPSDLVAALRTIGGFWLRMVRLPRGSTS